MRLTLSTLRCPDAVPPETRSVGGGEFSLGRAPDNSWVLQDPERHLSKRHCVFAFRNGGWQVADTSTNGTFLNREAEPIGQGRIRDLRDGDRVRLGAYEIEIRIEEAAFGAGAAGGGFGAGLGAAVPSRSASPFDDDPFAPAPLVVQGGSVSTGTGLGAGAGFGADQAPVFGSDSPLLPADFDPLAPAEPDPFTGPSIADHTPAFSDAFRPPPVTQGFGAPPAATPNLLPDDWDLDEPLLPAQAAPTPAPPVAPAAPAAAFLDDDPLIPAAAPVAPPAAVVPPTTPAAPAPFLDDEPLIPAAAPVAPPAAVVPPPATAAPTPFLDDEPLLPAAPVAPVAPHAPAAMPIAASPFAEPDDAPQPVAPVIAHSFTAAAAV
uniref:type VI secretion system-associated FHA domain protein n=1 Tax=Falsiroseomonas oryziterrae TaxID=2911368 RepID=UPI0023517DFB